MQNIKTRDFKRRIVENGFRFVRMKGSHATYRNADGITLTIPASDRELNACIARKMVKDYRLK